MMNFFDLENHGLEAEFLETVFSDSAVRIERIISRGQTTPPHEIYDQEENEWVLVLAGVGELTLDSGEVVRLEKGESFFIPAHCRHRVSYTADPTLWLCLFWPAS